jgi:hypothetical protein
MRWRNASRVATGPSTPATVTTAACSSVLARGVRLAARSMRRFRIRPLANNRSPRRSCFVTGLAATARGRPAAANSACPNSALRPPQLGQGSPGSNLSNQGTPHPSRDRTRSKLILEKAGIYWPVTDRFLQDQLWRGGGGVDRRGPLKGLGQRRKATQGRPAGVPTEVLGLSVRCGLSPGLAWRGSWVTRPCWLGGRPGRR